MILKLLLSIIVAFIVGKFVSRIKLPAILGWLVTGMILGPHAISVLGQEILDASWYQTLIHVLECAVGLMIGTELVWSKMKKSGKSIVIMTLTQSLGTFIVVSLVFGVVFYLSGIPMYLSFIFGGIALATAPAPALSIVREFKTNGPVTKTLIPMAALDDIVGCVVFFTTIAIVAGSLSSASLPAYMIAVVVLLPLIIGAVCGFISSFLLKKEMNDKMTFLSMIITILITSLVGFYFNNQVMPKPILNFMLIGMSFSAVFANCVSEERLDQMMRVFNPVLGIAMIIVILNLGAPLDYHLILGAGLFTAVYILSRAFGKYFGAYFGAAITHAPQTVKKYLGFTLLPHSGVSLVFTGIAVSALSQSAPESAKIVQGTIAAAAVINEVIAVIMAKKGFEWAGEMDSSVEEITHTSSVSPVVITINRQYGSGGLDIAKILSEKLNIPFYDSSIIDMAVEESQMDRLYFEKYERNKPNKVFDELSSSVSNHYLMDDQIFDYQKKVIQHVAENSCIVVGRCADYILKDRENVLNVFIYGDIENRKDRVVNVYHESEKDALQIIEKNDKMRESYHQYYSGKDFNKAENYDLCLNSGALGIDECVRIIQSLYKDNSHE